MALAMPFLFNVLNRQANTFFYLLTKTDIACQPSFAVRVIWSRLALPVELTTTLLKEV
jgi:hypothetical protein